MVLVRASLVVLGLGFLTFLLALVSEYPPTDEEGFMRFAEGLLVPDIANVIKKCDPVGPITSSRSMTMRPTR